MAAAPSPHSVRTSLGYEAICLGGVADLQEKLSQFQETLHKIERLKAWTLLCIAIASDCYEGSIEIGFLQESRNSLVRGRKELEVELSSISRLVTEYQSTLSFALGHDDYSSKKELGNRLRRAVLSLETLYTLLERRFRETTQDLAKLAWSLDSNRGAPLYAYQSVCYTFATYTPSEALCPTSDLHPGIDPTSLLHPPLSSTEPKTIHVSSLPAIEIKPGISLFRFYKSLSDLWRLEKKMFQNILDGLLFERIDMTLCEADCKTYAEGNAPIRIVEKQVQIASSNLIHYEGFFKKLSLFLGVLQEAKKVFEPTLLSYERASKDPYLLIEDSRKYEALLSDARGYFSQLNDLIIEAKAAQKLLESRLTKYKEGLSTLQKIVPND